MTPPLVFIFEVDKRKIQLEIYRSISEVLELSASNCLQNARIPYYILRTEIITLLFLHTYGSVHSSFVADCPQVQFLKKEKI